MELFTSNLTEREFFQNANKAGYSDSNAQLLISVLKNISLVLEDIRNENNKQHFVIPISSIDARLRQENYAVYICPLTY